ncbi:MAG TPA: polysaccharide biosynthesis protein, partial [Anaeromyxobacteraceae bacterium]|nr:polysaccharide biosynthesis protein [Anaeromyxobacteraceae bacterium]
MGGVLNTNPAVRSMAVLCLDVVATLYGLFGALRFWLNGDIQSTYAREAIIAAPLLVFIRIATILAARLHRWAFRGSGIAEGVRLVGAMLAASIAFAIAFPSLPRTVYALEFFLTLSAMTGFRFGPRLLEGWYAEWQRRGSASTARAIVVGAGDTGDLVARDLLLSDDNKYLVVGFVDDDRTRHGTYVSGKPVLGDLSALPQLIARHRISTVLLAIPRLPARRIRELLLTCAASRAGFKTIPASYSILDERISAAMLHDLSPEDLLQRDSVAFDVGDIRSMIEGRCALVTGAGGTIGGEICSRLASCGAAQLVMVDLNENEMYLGGRRLQAQYPSVRVYTEVADIREARRLNRLGERYQPEFVFHAAAHKHVPLMEAAPEEAVKNNVFGT